MAVMLRFVWAMVRFGQSWQLWQGLEWRVAVRPDRAQPDQTMPRRVCHAKPGLVGPGTAVLASPVRAGHGKAWRCEVCPGMARHGSQGAVWNVTACPGEARIGKAVWARQGPFGLGALGRGWQSWQVGARPVEAWYGLAVVERSGWLESLRN